MMKSRPNVIEIITDSFNGIVMKNFMTHDFVGQTL